MLHERGVKLGGDSLDSVPTASLHHPLHHHPDLAPEPVEPVLVVAAVQQRGDQRGELRGEVCLGQTNRRNLDETNRSLDHLAVAGLHEGKHRGKQLRNGGHESSAELVQQTRESHDRRALHRGCGSNHAGQNRHEKLAHTHAHLLPVDVVHTLEIIVAVRRIGCVLVLVLVASLGEPRAEHTAAAAGTSADLARTARATSLALHAPGDIHEETERLLPRPRVGLLGRHDELAEQHREGGPLGSHRDTLLGRILLGLAFHQAGQDRGYAPQAVPPRRGCAHARPLHQGLLGGVPVSGEPVTAEVGAGTDVGFHERREELVRALLHGGVLLQGGWSRSLEHEISRRVVQTGHHGQGQVHEGTPPRGPRVTALLEPIGRILGVGRHLDELTKDRAEETAERSRLGDLRKAPNRRAELAASLGWRRDEEVKEDGKKVAGVLGDGGRLTLRNLRGEPVGPVLQ